MKERTKVYLYTRVSTAMQIDGYSLEAQANRMKAYAEFNDYEIVGEYEDAGKSGKSIEGRIEFNRMMDDIKCSKDHVSYVLVFKLSRFGRNAADVLSTLQVMQDFGVNLICVEDGIDSSKDAGKLMISVLSAVAEIERENIRIQTMEGRIQKAREGKWNGGFAPYGYDLINGELHINEEEAKTVRLIYELYVHKKMGGRLIAQYLECHDIKKLSHKNTRGDMFAAAYIQDILRNPTYCGKIAYGRRKQEKVHGTRNDYRIVWNDDYLLTDGIHQPIVSVEDWEEAQARLRSQATKYKRYDRQENEHAYLLTGIIKCPECGKPMHRVPEVIDCWFDSGSMPFAQHHYPFENKELFEKQFPADFISEAVDQTRGWFYSLLAISTLIFNKAPYKNVIVLGHVQDENGQKMSKSKGNAVDPFDALEKYGADAIRWYFYVNSAPWLPNRFHGKAVVEGQRKFMGTLWNTYAFFVLYANIDDFDATKYTLDYDKLSVMDKWLLSKLNSAIKAVDYDLSNYKIPEAAKALQSFVDDMSNWYVRRSRERFWAKGMEQDKINAYMTLYTALVEICKTAAPMIPFMTEEIYQNLVRSVDKDAPESIHLCDFPTVNEAWIDKDLEADMKELLEIVVLGRACRNTANIKNRQPIGTMYVKAEKKMDKFYTDIIADELNVKEVKFADDVESFISYSFKPQLRTVGPKYGKLLNGIRTALSEIDGTAAMKELRENGVLTLDIDGNKVELAEEDLLIETAQTEGYVTETDGETSVVLDTNLTPELIQEGFVREIISKVQTMRKEAGFEVMDKIIVYAKDNDKIMDIMKANQDEIKREVLAENIILGEAEGYTKEWNINKEAVTLGVSKVQEEN